MLSGLTDAGVIIALIGVLGSLLKSKMDNKRLTSQQELEIVSAIEERKLLFRSLLIILHRLNDDGLDGDIEKAISSVEEFLLDASHRSIPGHKQ